MLLLVMNHWMHAAATRISGVTESRSINLTLQKSAEIKEILVTIGQHVEAGQVVAILDIVELRREQNRVAHELQTLEAENRIQKEIRNLAQANIRGSHSLDPLKIKIDSLKKELKLIEDEIEKSKLTAPTAGTVTSITRSVGETIAAFTPMITIIPDAPKYATGYLPEQNISSMKRGELVDVQSIMDPNKKSSGQIIGFGTQMVPFHERLQPSPQTPVLWGREIFIELANNNQFFSGEKVTVIYPAQDGSKRNRPGLFMVRNP